jgi:hypothetical protein
VLATQFGAHAVRLIIESKFGEMVCYQPPSILSVPIIEAVNRLSQVDANSSAVQAARALGISFGDTSDLRGPFGIEARNAIGKAQVGINQSGSSCAAELQVEPTLNAVASMPAEWEAAAAYADAAV